MSIASRIRILSVLIDGEIDCLLPRPSVGVTIRIMRELWTALLVTWFRRFIRHL